MKTKLALSCIEPLKRRVRPDALDADAVARYAEIYRDETARRDMPAIVVFQEKGCERWIVADGEHRLEAARRAKLDQLEVDLRAGDEISALDFALGCNRTHGLPRRVDDTWHVFCLLMDTPELRKRHATDQEKADAIGVHRNTIVNYKADYRDCDDWAHLVPIERRKRLKKARESKREEQKTQNEKIETAGQRASPPAQKPPEQKKAAKEPPPKAESPKWTTEDEHAMALLRSAWKKATTAARLKFREEIA